MPWSNKIKLKIFWRHRCLQNNVFYRRTSPSFSKLYQIWASYEWLDLPSKHESLRVQTNGSSGVRSSRSYLQRAIFAAEQNQKKSSDKKSEDGSRRKHSEEQCTAPHESPQRLKPVLRVVYFLSLIVSAKIVSLSCWGNGEMVLW